MDAEELQRIERQGTPDDLRDAVNATTAAVAGRSPEGAHPLADAATGPQEPPGGLLGALAEKLGATPEALEEALAAASVNGQHRYEQPERPEQPAEAEEEGPTVQLFGADWPRAADTSIVAGLLMEGAMHEVQGDDGMMLGVCQRMAYEMVDPDAHRRLRDHMLGLRLGVGERIQAIISAAQGLVDADPDPT